MSALELFRGTLALLMSRRASLLHLPLWLGLLPALCVGGLVVLANEARPGVIEDLLLPVFAIACVVAPLVIGLPWTAVMQVGTPVRRDELLALPVGRLAIPAAVLVGSAALVALWALAVLLGLVATIGVGPFAAFSAWGKLPGWSLAALLLFAAATCFGALGATWAQVVLVLPAMATFLVIGMTGMGYDDDAMRAYGVAWTLAGVGYFLALPFLLYARPIHLWSASREGRRETPALAGLFFGGLAVVALALAGGGTALSTLVLGTGVVLLARRRLSSGRRDVPALLIAGVAAVVPAAPLVGLGLVVDARGDAQDGAWRDFVPVRVVPSPDGRQVALELGRAAGVSRRPDRRQVVVVDLAGERPPLVIPARFASLPEDGAAWSRDGRWLAAYDATFGRLRKDNFQVGVPLDGRFDYLAVELVSAPNETWLVDTHAGAVELRGSLELAPGWSGPDDLVALDAAPERTHVLRDAAGRELRVPMSRGELDVVAYDAGRPIVRVGHSGTQRLATRDLGLLPAGGLSRWPADKGALEAYDPRPRDGGTYEIDLSERERSIVVARGERRLEVEDGELALLAASDDSSALVLTRTDGLVRVSLLDGARTPVVPGATAVHWVDPSGARALVARGEDEVGLVDLTSGAWTTLRGPAGATLCLTSGGGRLVQARGWPLLVSPGGDATSLCDLLLTASK